MVLQGWRQVLDLLFPRACLLCRRLVVDEFAASICSDCHAGLVPIERACARCGAPIRTKSESVRLSDCRYCKSQRWDFGRAWCYTVYRSGAAQAVRLMKEPHCESLARSLGDSMAVWLRSQASFSTMHYDCIVPIPQYWIRRLTQRYNQASALGERLSCGLGLPMSETVLRRSRWTQKQGMKTISERRENLLGAFEVRSPKQVRYRSFLIVDDVMTSGATLQEAAKVLRQAGARRVDAIVFARGVNAIKPTGGLENRPPSKDPLTFDQNHSDPQKLPSLELRRRIH